MSLPPDFLIRAWLAGLGLALAAGPLGCFVVWRRMAYLGDALSHGALLGVTLGLVLAIEPSLAVAITTVALALLLLALQRQRRLSSDTSLGILAHGALATGLVALGLVGSFRVDLLGYLLGDILAVGQGDLVLIWGGGLAVVAILALAWRPLVLATLDEDMAAAEGLPVGGLRLLLTLSIALVIAAAMKIVGALLITATLVLPAAAARAIARSPAAMAVAAVLVGWLATTAGLLASWHLDTPAGASIVLAALLAFVLVQPLGALIRARS